MKRIFFSALCIAFTTIALAQETYTLSDKSVLTIDGSSTIHDWTVTANTMKGELKTDGKTPKEIDFEVDVENINSERGAAMDKKMHEALKKEEHPKVTFTLKETIPESSLAGTLNIAGQEKEIEIPLQMETYGETIEFIGEHRITLQDYGIEPPTAMFGQIIVGDEVTVKFDLVFSKN